jgi:two-component system LytT family response regulator
MIRCIIVDDEQHNIDNLCWLLQQYCPEVLVTGTAANAAAARELIMQHPPDLLFLDIQMPGGNGFDLLQSLPNRAFEVVFVTAYDHYGIQAVKFAAIDYLLKPIRMEELQAAVQKLTGRRQQQQNLQLENLLQLVQHQANRAEHRIALPMAREIRLVKTMEIVRCESNNNYTTFYFRDGEKLLVARPIYEYDELLADYGFLRVHQSHLVNKAFIRSWIKEDGGYLLLQDNSVVPVSRQKKDLLKQVIRGIMR